MRHMAFIFPINGNICATGRQLSSQSVIVTVSGPWWPFLSPSLGPYFPKTRWGHLDVLSRETRLLCRLSSGHCASPSGSSNSFSACFVSRESNSSQPQSGTQIQHWKQEKARTVRIVWAKVTGEFKGVIVLVSVPHATQTLTKATWEGMDLLAYMTWSRIITEENQDRMWNRSRGRNYKGTIITACSYDLLILESHQPGGDIMEPSHINY